MLEAHRPWPTSEEVGVGEQYEEPGTHGADHTEERGEKGTQLTVCSFHNFAWIRSAKCRHCQSNPDSGQPYSG